MSRISRSTAAEKKKDHENMCRINTFHHFANKELLQKELPSAYSNDCRDNNNVNTDHFFCADHHYVEIDCFRPHHQTQYKLSFSSAFFEACLCLRAF